MRPRVAPRPASFRCTGDGASKRLECTNPSDLQRAQRVNLRVAPHLLFCDASESLMHPRLPGSASSGIADGEPASCLAFSLPRLPLVDGSSSCLAQRTLRRRRRCVCVTSASCPADCSASCSYGWADVTPRLEANLASPAMPRMNLCSRPAPAHSRLTLDAISTEPRRSQPAPAVERCAQSDFASSCLRGTAFPIPWRSPTGEELRMVESVEASAKKELICGFHQL